MLVGPVGSFPVGGNGGGRAPEEVKQHKEADGVDRSTVDGKSGVGLGMHCFGKGPIVYCQCLLLVNWREWTEVLDKLKCPD